MQAFAPAAAAHQTAGELVHDHHFTVLHHIVLVTVVDVVGTQGSVQVVHQRDVGGVVQRRAFGQQAGGGQNLLRLFVTVFGQEHLVALFVDREVAGLGHAFARAGVGLTLLAHQLGSKLVDGLVHGRVVIGLAGDDQRRARLIDQDGIHLVNDGVVQAPLHAIGLVVDHVVAQVVETVLVVGAVGDVGQVGQLLFLTRRLGQVHPHGQAQEVVERAHGLRIAAGQVVVHGHDVHTLAGQRIQVDRQGRGQRLAFARAHFRNLALVQADAPHQLHIEVAHLQHALGGLAHHGEGFGQQIVQCLALDQA